MTQRTIVRDVHAQPQGSSCEQQESATSVRDENNGSGIMVTCIAYLAVQVVLADSSENTRTSYWQKPLDHHSCYDINLRRTNEKQASHFRVPRIKDHRKPSSLCVYLVRSVVRASWYHRTTNGSFSSRGKSRYLARRVCVPIFIATFSGYREMSGEQKTEILSDPKIAGLRHRKEMPQSIAVSREISLFGR